MRQCVVRVVLLACAAACVGWWLPGCGVSPRAAGSGAERIDLRRPIETPPGLDAARLTPLTGDAAERARMSLDAVLAALGPGAEPAPDASEEPDAAGAPESPADPSLAAQRRYLEGRRAWRQGRTFDAIRLLEEARRFAPDQPAILRLLGRVYTDANNRVRGTAYLEDAVALDPTDLETVFLLGRQRLQNADWDEAIRTFGRTLRLLETQGGDRPGAEPLIRHYLAVALRHAGYSRAAVEQYERYLTLPRPGPGGDRFRQELAFVDRQQGLAWQAVGDLYNRLGEPAAAAEPYARAAELGVPSDLSLAKRRVYTWLRLGAVEPARAAVLDLVRQRGLAEDTLAMVGYLVRQGVSAGPLEAELRELYARSGRGTAAAVSLAVVLPQRSALRLLREHLAEHPRADAAFEAWLSRRIGDGGRGAEAGRDAVRLAAGLLPARPGGAAWLVDRLAGALGSEAEVIARVEEARAALGNGPAAPPAGEAAPEATAARLATLGAAARMRQGDFGSAAEALESAAAREPGLVAARVELARARLLLGQPQRAAAALEPLSGVGDPAVVAMRVRVLTASGEHAAALALLERLAEDAPLTDTQLVLDRAALLRRLDRADDAERVLLDALNADPTDQRVYAALFDLYDSSQAGRDAAQQYQRLMRRLLGAIPESRLAKLKLAEVHTVRREYDRAEALLTGLLDADPRDLEAAGELLEVYVRSDQTDRGRALMASLLEQRARDRAVLMLAQRFYQEIGDAQRLFEVTETALRMEPAGEDRARRLALLYLSHAEPARAAAELETALAAGGVEAPARLYALLWRARQRMGEIDRAKADLRQAIDRYPDAAADLGFELAMLLERSGDTAGSRRVMRDVLAEFPDHAPTNNALGYAWTLEHTRLEEARAMIHRAVRQEPDNAAYLDSMGWVYYKLGRFGDAVAWLRKAAAAPGGAYPVILDHLGDALYRAGETASAVREWRRAASLSRRETGSEDPELVGLEQRAAEKVSAVSRNAEPTVAASPGGDGGPDADEPVGPEAMPAAAPDDPGDDPGAVPGAIPGVGEPADGLPERDGDPFGPPVDARPQG